MDARSLSRKQFSPKQALTKSRTKPQLQGNLIFKDSLHMFDIKNDYENFSCERLITKEESKLKKRNKKELHSVENQSRFQKSKKQLQKKNQGFGRVQERSSYQKKEFRSLISSRREYFSSLMGSMKDSSLIKSQKKIVEMGKKYFSQRKKAIRNNQKGRLLNLPLNPMFYDNSFQKEEFKTNFSKFLYPRKDSIKNIVFEINCRTMFLNVKDIDGYFKEIISSDLYDRNELVYLFKNRIVLEREEDCKILASYVLKLNINISRHDFIKILLNMLGDWKPLSVSEPSVRLKAAVNYSHRSLLSIFESKANSLYLSLTEILNFLEGKSMFDGLSDKLWMMGYLYGLNQSIYHVPYSRAIAGIVDLSIPSSIPPGDSSRNVSSSKTGSFSSIIT